MIDRLPQLAVASRQMLVPLLIGCEAHVMIPIRSFLGCARSCTQPTLAAVVTHAIHRDVVNDSFVVDSSDVCRADIRD